MLISGKVNELTFIECKAFQTTVVAKLKLLFLWDKIFFVQSAVPDGRGNIFPLFFKNNFFESSAS